MSVEQAMCVGSDPASFNYGDLFIVIQRCRDVRRFAVGVHSKYDVSLEKGMGKTNTRRGCTGHL
jgi:hypothetical protein